jgi:hypothetical protein
MVLSPFKGVFSVKDYSYSCAQYQLISSWDAMRGRLTCSGIIDEKRWRKPSAQNALYFRD